LWQGNSGKYADDKDYDKKLNPGKAARKRIKT
jgi:hypothetical protein